MNLERHIDKATAAFTAAYSKADSWRTEKVAAFEKYHKDALRLTKDAAVEENARLVKLYADKFATIENTLLSELAEIETAYSAEVKNFYAPDGAAIDAADNALLNVGILTVQELTEMVTKHAENPTMLRIIERYTKEQRIELSGDVQAPLVKARSGGNTETKIFDTFKQLALAPVYLAASENVGREVFMRAAMSLDDYAENAKLNILRAKLVLTDSEKEALQQAEHKRMVAQNGGYDPHATADSQ